MKELKMLKKISLFMLMFMLIFSLEGCGGGGSGPLSSSNIQDDDEVFAGISGDILAKGNDDPEVLRVLDKILTLDEFGVPAIFDYAPLPKNIDTSLKEAGTPLNLPAIYVLSEDLNKDGEFIVSVDLEQDTQYIIKYSHASRTLNGARLDLRITAPENQSMILDLMGGHVKSSYDIDFENRGIISKSIYVDTECEFIPEENPCIILYSFKAPLTGNYEFALKEINQYDIDDEEKLFTEELPFEFRIYTIGEVHSALDGEEEKLSARQIVDIQRILLDAAVKFDECLLPTNFDESSGYEEYDEYGNAILSAISDDQKGDRYNYRGKVYTVLSDTYGSSNSNNSNGDKPVIPSRLEVPYDKTFAPGAGIYGHSGLRSIQLTALFDDIFSDSAIKDFTIGPPEGVPKVAKFSINNISTEEDFLRASGMDSNSNITLLKDALDNTNRFLARLGFTHAKTLYLRYEYREDVPRMPKFDKIEIRPESTHLLKDDYDTFWREHGDYFVAGYTFGLVFEAVIDIHAQLYDCAYSSETVTPQYSSTLIVEDAEHAVRMIAERIQAAFSNNDARDLEIMDRNLKKSKNVTVSFSNINASGVMEAPHVSSLSGLMKIFNDFKEKAKQTPSSQYRRLYATLIRYREIENVKEYIPEALPITETHYRMIRDLNKAVYSTRCYLNSLGSIPADHLINGTGKYGEWKGEYDKLSGEYKNRLNQLCSDIKSVSDYLSKFNAMSEKYRALAHRYVFYRKMLAFQKKHFSLTTRRTEWENSSAGWGYPHFSYGYSHDGQVAINDTLVEDLKNSSSINNPRIRGIARLFESFVDWERIQRHTFDKGARIYYYEGGPIDTIASCGWDHKGWSFGRRSYDWEFKRSAWGTLRRIEFTIEFKIISMPDDKYPFTGLID